jgi:hypothetical protein
VNMSPKVAMLVAEYGPLLRDCSSGHTWESLGGRNCGCEWREHGSLCHGNCSVPVNHCVVCGDCDYGDNEDARETISECACYGFAE